MLVVRVRSTPPSAKSTHSLNDDHREDTAADSFSRELGKLYDDVVVDEEQQSEVDPRKRTSDTLRFELRVVGAAERIMPQGGDLRRRPK